MKSTTKILVGVFAAIAIVGIVTYLNRVSSSGAGLVSDVELGSRPVEVEPVEPRRLVETLVQTGTLQANRDVVLSAEVAGKVQKVHRDLGDRCKRGEPLVQLDPSGYQIAVLQAKAAHAQAKAAFEQSARDLKRTETLHQREAVAAYELERAQSGERTTAAVVEQAAAALRLAKRNLHETTIRCPFDGVVAARLVELGQLVGPQTPLARVVDTERLKLTLTVGAAQLARLELGQRVRLADPSIPDRSYDGEVARLGVAADPVTRTFPVEVLVAGGETGPKPGQVVRGVIELAVHERALSVPDEALVSENGQSAVFLARDGKAHRQMVTVGPHIDGAVIVRSGLAAGAPVIVVGNENLRHGDPVTVSPSAAASASARA
ncbi:MAG: efflux RND transporter periplasmic adaptor subunit, partial [Deltaproteobacteria bacterium]|nr:efflux RND transporter periplasmic adaptor subunit [Deltaproteobacteria bacterium]MBW2530834.1 efflux RND transporter periplasmic adaptor subunit [Deltaproteobacteria bacterium]